MSGFSYSGCKVENLLLQTDILSAISEASVSILTFFYYDKCPKISISKVSDKMPYTRSADPDQTAPSDKRLHRLPFH